MFPATGTVENPQDANRIGNLIVENQVIASRQTAQPHTEFVLTCAKVGMLGQKPDNFVQPSDDGVGGGGIIRNDVVPNIKNVFAGLPGANDLEHQAAASEAWR